jgi:hypothetical protein
MDENVPSLLRALLSVAGRSLFPPDELAKLVGGPKQIKAFNLCDGSRTMAEVAKASKIDNGNFSRTLARWVEEGIAFRIGEGKETKPLRLYQLKESGRKNRDK